MPQFYFLHSEMGMIILSSLHCPKAVVPTLVYTGIAKGAFSYPKLQILPHNSGGGS